MVSIQFNSVQSLSHVRLLATPYITARQASLSITNSRSSLRLTYIESVMPSSHLILCCPLLLPLPPIPPSIRVISNESTLRTRWPKYWKSYMYPLTDIYYICYLFNCKFKSIKKIFIQNNFSKVMQSLLYFREEGMQQKPQNYRPLIFVISFIDITYKPVFK